MKRPIIGISGNFLIDDSGIFPGYERAYLNNDYITAIVQAGGIPYIIPIVEDEDVIAEQIKNIDGLLLSGGQDVNPLLYNEEPRRELGIISKKRDFFDTCLIKNAMKAKKPILGICRGYQMLNVVNGGALYQDLKYSENSYIKHNQNHSPNMTTHSVIIEDNSRLRKFFDKTILVNSFHHQAIKKVAENFKIAAMAKDGIIEAIESKDEDHFMVGVQWHPEMLAKDNENMNNLFKAFIKAVLDNL